MQNKKYYIQVVVSMIGALFLSYVFIAVFFPSQNPVIRSNLASYISETTGSLVSQVGNTIPKFTLPSFNLFTQVAPEQNATSVTPVSSGNTINPEQSAIAAGIRQQLSTQKLVPSLPGIYTTGNATSYLTVLKQNEASWGEINLNVKGKTVTVRVPQGQTPPSAQMLEQM